MIITKKCLPRRTVLRGLGASLALPLLDGMVPAFAAIRNTAANPPRRLGVVYVPNGMAMPYWTPEAVGNRFELTPILAPLDRFREQLLVISGLRSSWSYVHAGASASFLTGTPRGGENETDVLASTSMDQILARELGKTTQLGSLEVAIDKFANAGQCTAGLSCAYTQTISWRTPTTPLPMENNPRYVFERLFGDSGTTDPAVRKARMAKDASLLDSVTDRARALSRALGSSDQAKLEQYLEAVRDIERRIQMAESRDNLDLPVFDRPAGIPGTFGEHSRLMFDLLALAYETDLTRVATFMMGREITGRTYAEIGVPDAHHPISHHQRDPLKLEKLKKINSYHVELFAEFIERLASTPEGDGTLLDNSMIIYGAGMADSNAHYSGNLPILLAGGGAGTGGRHIRYDEGTPLANLHLSLLDKMGVPIESLGDSSGRLPLEPLSGL